MSTLVEASILGVIIGTRVEGENFLPTDTPEQVSWAGYEPNDKGLKVFGELWSIWEEHKKNNVSEDEYIQRNLTILINMESGGAGLIYDSELDGEFFEHKKPDIPWHLLW